MRSWQESAILAMTSAVRNFDPNWIVLPSQILTDSNLDKQRKPHIWGRGKNQLSLPRPRILDFEGIVWDSIFFGVLFVRLSRFCRSTEDATRRGYFKLFPDVFVSPKESASLWCFPLFSFGRCTFSKRGKVHNDALDCRECLSIYDLFTWYIWLCL